MELSLIVPVFNAGKTLARTLRSLEIIASEHRDRVEVLLVNDGSTDDSGALLRSFAAHAPFPAVRYLKKDNGGSASAKNVGLDVATAEWVLFLDADDELAADPVPFLADAAACSALVFSIDIALPGGRRIRKTPHRLPPDALLDALTAANPFPSPSVLVRRGLVSEQFDEDLRLLEDWHFWLTNPRLWDHVRWIPASVLAVVHVHESNKSGDYIESGRHRQRIAADLLRSRAGSLSRKQENNLTIQLEIGRRLQGMRPRLRAFLAFPCNPRLYGKLLVYTILGRNIRRIDLYRSAARR